MSENVLQSSYAVIEQVQSGGLSGYAVLQADLRKLELNGRALSDVAFRKVTLEQVPAADATCRSVRFEASRLRGLNLSGGLLSDTRLMNCEAHEFNLCSACVIRMQIFDTPMANARFDGARLQDCVFQSADLYGACFDDALLMHCRFSDPRMENAGLNRASFQRAMLIDVDLRGANLHGANFTDALLVRVDLREANLVRAEMSGATLIACDTTGSVR